MITAISQLELNGILMSTSGTSLLVGSQTVVYQSQTGNFITSSQTGAFGGGGNTGVLTGVFYPLLTNPSGYLTGFNSGLFTLNSSTGNFVDTLNTQSIGGLKIFTNTLGGTSLYGYGGGFGTVDLMHAQLSSSGNITVDWNQKQLSGNWNLGTSTGLFITTGMTGSFGGNSNTGILTGAFYPLNNNPSGYTTFNSFSNLTWSTTTNWTCLSNAIEDKKILILTGSTTLNISGLYNGWCGVLETIQSGVSSSGYNLILPSNTKVMGSGNGLANLTMQSGAIDCLGFVYDGIRLLCNIGNQFN